MNNRIINAISSRVKSTLSRNYLQYRKIRNDILLNKFPERLGLTPGDPSSNFSDLRKEIDQLASHIDADYVYLDIPNYGNIGDHMIYKGSIDFLKTLPVKQTYRAAINNFNADEINSDSIIILQGGGNFGDIWEAHQLFRESVIQSFPNNKIIIFPQTIFFREKKNLEKTADIFNSHPNLIICARDYRSYQIAQSSFGKNTILLVPDMAFYMNMGIVKSPPQKIENVLYMKRKDKELKSSVQIPTIANMEIRDWPTYDFDYFKYLPDKFSQYSFYIDEGIYFMSYYDLIITTRLHGSILAALLGIPAVMIDNSYGKNSTFYETWMKSVPQYYLCQNKEDLINILETHFPQVLN